jgi:hypothetical protein
VTLHRESKEPVQYHGLPAQHGFLPELGERPLNQYHFLANDYALGGSKAGTSWQKREAAIKIGLHPGRARRSYSY